MSPLDPLLEEVLSKGQRLHLLGPGDLDTHVEHALGFLCAVPASAGERGLPAEGARVLDLGSGGGLPGLVLASFRPDLTVALLDANQRRTSFLREAVVALGLAPRVSVLRARAEDSGREPSLRGAFDLVVARGFGKPAVTAECGAPFLRTGGLLVVSEPPTEGVDEAVRWPPEALAALGLRPIRRHRGAFAYQVLGQERRCPETYPRRSGIPAKRPLF